MPRSAAVIVGVLVMATGCGGDDDSPGRDTTSPVIEDDVDVQRFPDIVAVDASEDAGTWSFQVTVSSPYDTPGRYADGWRVVGPDGEVFGEHTLLHDHANEQPFTRTQSGVVIPDDVDTVIIEGRDQQYGYGGATVTVELGGS